jgi:hypothetical protein
MSNAVVIPFPGCTSLTAYCRVHTVHAYISFFGFILNAALLCFFSNFEDLLQTRGCESLHCYMWGPVSWFEHCDSGDSVWALDPVWCP